MASIKIKFRPSSDAEHEGSIYYQIIHERKVRQLFTDYKIFPSEWDRTRSKIVFSNRIDREPFIKSILECVRRDVERLTRINRMLESNARPYSAGDVIEEYNRYMRDYSLFNFMESIIARLKSNGKIRTSETYKSALNSFKKFRNGEDIMLDCLTSEIMEAFEAWHKNRGITPNTISFYTRILRAVYNRAIEEAYIEDRRPFRHVYTGVDKTVKRALPLHSVREIQTLDLKHASSLDFARDMFMISFYMTIVR